MIVVKNASRYANYMLTILLLNIQRVFSILLLFSTFNNQITYYQTFFALTLQ